MTNAIPTMIIPTLNGHDRLIYLLNSIDYPVDKIIIIDNGNLSRLHFGAAGIEARLHNMHLINKIHMIHLPSNLGVAASWNLGIKVTPFSPYWFIVNDDVTFPAGSLERFAEHMENHETISVADNGAPWCAFGISEHVVSVVGLFDEVFYPAYYEDTDYARRAREYMGEDVIYNSGVVFNHANSSTIAGGFTEQNQRTFFENQRQFEAKLSLNQFDPFGWQLNVRRANDWGV